MSILAPYVKNPLATCRSNASMMDALGCALRCPACGLGVNNGGRSYLIFAERQM